jgi:hypothetical protein
MEVNQSISVEGSIHCMQLYNGNIETVNEIAFISKLPKGSLRILCIANKVWEGDRLQSFIDNILPESYSISPGRQED